MPLIADYCVCFQCPWWWSCLSWQEDSCILCLSWWQYLLVNGSPMLLEKKECILYILSTIVRLRSSCCMSIGKEFDISLPLLQPSLLQPPLLQPPLLQPSLLQPNKKCYQDAFDLKSLFSCITCLTSYSNFSCPWKPLWIRDCCLRRARERFAR